MKRGLPLIISVLLVLSAFGDEGIAPRGNFKVLPPITQDNLTVFPVVGDKTFDTSQFLTLDEGIRSGKVVVTEMGSTGLIRLRPDNGGWSERPLDLPNGGASVNQLALINNSDRPLILLAGEIVTGGKQDRVVGKDRIIPAHSKPVALDVFCVEPHRWMGASAGFGATAYAMAQPSVRSRAMADRNQQQVWNEVAKARDSFAASVPALRAFAFQSSSSYAQALREGSVERQLNSIVVPLERSYEQLLPKLRAQKAAGVVVAINNEIIWADLFASPALLNEYWPKLIRSYAAEALAPHVSQGIHKPTPSQQSAQSFLDRLDARHESVESDPGVYRNTELQADDFEAFLLTSLLPHTGYQVHMAKMER